MIYHLVNNRTEILPIATSLRTRSYNYFNHAFALLISRPRFKSSIFFKIDLKLCDFQKKFQNFRALQAEPSNPLSPALGSSCPPKPETVPSLPPIRNFCLCTCNLQRQCRRGQENLLFINKCIALALSYFFHAKTGFCP